MLLSLLLFSFSASAEDAATPVEAPAVEAPAPAAPQIATYSGTYAVTSDPARIQAELDSIVNAAAENFPFYAEGIARGKLRDAVTFCRKYDISASPTEWTNTCDALSPLTVPYGKTPVTWTSGAGNPVKVTTFRQGDTVRVKLKGDTGTRTNVFKFSGDTMTLHATLEGDSLDEPVRWTVKYKKQ